MGVSKDVYEALKQLLTMDSRVDALSKAVEAVSARLDTFGAATSSHLEDHAQRIARLEGKFDLIETSFSARRRRLPPA
jgi:archaellum component FlaC